MTILEFHKGDETYLDGIRQQIAQCSQPETMRENLPPLLRAYRQPDPSEALLTATLAPCHLLFKAMDDLMLTYLGRHRPSGEQFQTRPSIWELEQFAEVAVDEATVAQRRDFHLGHMLAQVHRTAVLTADAQGFDSWQMDFQVRYDDLKNPLQAALLYATQSAYQIGVIECGKLRHWDGARMFVIIEAQRPGRAEQSGRSQLRPN